MLGASGRYSCLTTRETSNQVGARCNAERYVSRGTATTQLYGVDFFK